MDWRRMTARLDDRTKDIAMVVIANLVNISIVGIMLSRPMGLEIVERVSGLFIIALGLPVLVLAILNIMGKREWWTYVLPLLLGTFIIVEFILEYVLKIEFRRTILLGPYLLIYYVSVMGMIGYSFLVEKRYGLVTLVTYFLSLAATWYSYTMVGY